MKKQEAEDIHRILRDNFKAVLDEQVDRTVMTSVVATGLMTVQMNIIGNVLSSMVPPESDQPGDSQEPTDLSKIILAPPEIKKISDSENDNERAEKAETEESQHTA